MPNKETFKIKPIKRILGKYIGGLFDSEKWIDPFAGNNSPANYRNDLNPDVKTLWHLEAIDFVRLMNKDNVLFDGCLFDPPYSPRQIKECYDGFGLKANTKATFYPKVKDELALVIKPNGIAISFGWNSNGFGKCRGFELIEVLLIAHGGSHNDTIVTIERKVNQTKILRGRDE